MMEALEEHVVYSNLAYSFILENWDQFVKTASDAGEPLTSDEQIEVKRIYRSLQANAHRLATAFAVKAMVRQ